MIQLPKSQALSNLSLTPLIDVVFLLVIFFLVTSRFSEEERRMDINIPEAASSAPMISVPKELVINIDREGHYYLAADELDRKTLVQTLEVYHNANPGTSNVIIRADKTCPFEHVFFCVDMCRKTGITEYYVTARQLPGE